MIFRQLTTTNNGNCLHGFQQHLCRNAAARPAAAAAAAACCSTHRSVYR